MSKTPEYTKKAIANYQQKFDRVTLNLPKGTKERVKAATSESLTSIIVRLLDDELKKLENQDQENPFI